MKPGNLLIADKARVSQWVFDHVGGTGTPWFEPYECIGLERNGQLVAGCVFNNYVRGGSIEMHLAATPGPWAFREVLGAGFRYAFHICDVRRVTAYTAMRNVRCQRFLHHLGFQYEGTLKNALPNDSLRVYGLLREHCRFLWPPGVTR